MLAAAVASCGPTISSFSPIAYGLAFVRVDQFRSSLIDLVIGTAFKTFL